MTNSVDMVERVAKAIFSDDDSRKWEDIEPHWREIYRSRARAAIEAMREPTDAMCEAGYSAATGSWDGRYGSRIELARGRTEPKWRSMIDAALQRGEIEAIPMVDDAMVERAWAAIVGGDIALQCFNVSIVRGDLRTALKAALQRDEK